MTKIRKISTLLEDRQSNWDQFLETKKQLEANGFGMWTSDTGGSVSKFGYTKRYSVYSGTPTTYTAGIYFGLTPDYEIVNVVVITSYEHYSGTEHSTGPINTQRTPVNTVEDAIDYIKQYYQQELDRHKGQLIRELNAALKDLFISKYLTMIYMLRSVGVDWLELEQNVVLQTLEQNKHEIIRNLLERFKKSPSDPTIERTLDALRKKFPVAWPELEVIEKSQKTLPRY
jgi:hypothetical protein